MTLFLPERHLLTTETRDSNVVEKKSAREKQCAQNHVLLKKRHLLQNTAAWRHKLSNVSASASLPVDEKSNFLLLMCTTVSDPAMAHLTHITTPYVSITCCNISEDRTPHNPVNHSTMLSQWGLSNFFDIIFKLQMKLTPVCFFF